MPYVVICELGILASAVMIIVSSGPQKSDAAPAATLYAVLIISVALSLVWEKPFPDPVRNLAIITLFTMLGARTNDRLIRKVFLVSTCLVGAFLFLESAFLTAYVALFQPALYLENTRGLTQFSLNTTGLFANALGFQGRFSYGLFSGPRTSSIFLEQVSLAGYSAVLTIFLVSKWKSLTRLERIAHIALVIAILVTNNTRTASALAFVSIPAYFIYPRLPKYANALIGPFLLLAAWVVVAHTHVQPYVKAADDLSGRLRITINDLGSMTASELLIGNLPRIPHLYDSGYGYIICSMSLTGVALFWWYISFIVPQTYQPSKRAAWAAGAYICTWLCIGGTAIFTMKTAALLWLLMGHMRAAAADDLRMNKARNQVA